VVPGDTEPVCVVAKEYAGPAEYSSPQPELFCLLPGDVAGALRECGSGWQQGNGDADGCHCGRAPGEPAYANRTAEVMAFDAGKVTGQGAFGVGLPFGRRR
jgi:hypothetical protein